MAEGSGSKKKIVPIMHTFEFCDNAEQKNGKYSFHGLFGNIFLLRFPASHPHFHVVLGFSQGKGKFVSKIIIRSPSNRELSRTSVKFELPDTYAVFYNIITVNNLQLVELGNYTVTVYLGKKKIGERMFGVLIRKPPEFSEEQIVELLKKEDVTKSGKVELKCPNCNSFYTFQLNLDPKKPIDKTALPFPENNRFRCPNDDFEIDLTGLKVTLQGGLGSPIPETKEGQPVA